MEKRVVIKWALIGIGLILLIPIIVFLCVDQFNIIGSNIESKEWLMFWASYMGGTIGGACTLIAVMITVKNAIYSQAEAQIIRDKEISENRKYQYAPFLISKIVPDTLAYSYEIVRFIYSPEESIDMENFENFEFNMELWNCGFGPATNLYVFHDGQYIVNGVNAVSNDSFALQECVTLPNDSKVVCKVRLCVSKDLIEKNPWANKMAMLDYVYQDMLGNIIRKEMCISLEPEKRVQSDMTPEYMSLDKLVSEYPHVENITSLFVMSE